MFAPSFFGLCKPTCTKQRTAPRNDQPGSVLLLNGISLSGKTALARQLPSVRTLNEDQLYIGSHVPQMGLAKSDRMAKLLDWGATLASLGDHVVIDFVDTTGTHRHQSGAILPAHVPTATALIFLPFEHIPHRFQAHHSAGSAKTQAQPRSLLRALLQFGTQHSGSPVPLRAGKDAADSYLQRLSRSAFDRTLREALTTYAQHERPHHERVRAYLTRRLGFEDPAVNEVLVTSVLPYDIVINTSTQSPKQAVRRLQEALRQVQAGKRSSGAVRSGVRNPPSMLDRALADSCLAASPPPATRAARVLSYCAVCGSPHAHTQPLPVTPALLEHLAHPERHGNLNGTNLLSLSSVFDFGTHVIQSVAKVADQVLQPSESVVPETVVIPPTIPAGNTRSTGTVIWLHGMGDNGDNAALGMSPLIGQFPEFKWVFPTAPMVPVSLFQGFRQRAWFDVKAMNFEAAGNEDQKGIAATAAMVHQLIQEEESAGVPSSHIILGGFSQGGAIATFAALSYPRPLMGVICCSSYIPLRDTNLASAKSEANANTPIFMGHGDMDVLIPQAWSDVSFKWLTASHPTGDLHVRHIYPGMGHTISDEELGDIANWIRSLRW
eukprot:TRINITY_DN8304_c0_g1_i1.p1 TRINITY_DN8304_c0_g1~~TRINITY_DN8304_c0_g1_i1.p1  ORF type:complete len:621 (-),score=62.08 TRINITY_DN8304_c0_g1_i1:17-1837(-)